MKFTEEHEWLDTTDEEGVYSVGITQHAAEALGELVFLELPKVGKKVTKGDEVAVIESVKAASEILAPLDGEIVDVNEPLVDNVTLVNDDPTGAAWFFRIKLDNPSELDDLLDEDAYKALIE